jgi:S-adenosylmethionine synthetase
MEKPAHFCVEINSKDPTKVDRSAAYAARYLAKTVRAAGLDYRCTINISYAIRVENPLSIYVDRHGIGHVVDTAIERAIAGVMDLTLHGIRTQLA